MTPLSNDIGVESTDAMSLGNLGDDLEKACVEQNTQQMIHSSVDEARLPDAAKDAGVSISRNDFLSELSSFPTATTTTLSIHAAAATHSPGSTHETSDQATSSYLPTTRHTIARPGNNLPVPPSSETDARESFLNGLQDLSSLLGRVFGGPTPTTVSTPTAEASTSALHSILMNVNPLKDPLPPSLMERDEFEHAHVELSDVTTSASVIPLAGTLPVSEEMFNPEITNASSELTSTTTAAESIFRSRRVPMVDVPFSHKDNMRLVEYIVDHTDVNEQHDFIEFYEIMVRQVDIVKYTWVQRHFPSAWHQHYTCYQRQFDHAETLLRCANHLEEMWAYKRKYGYSIVARPVSLRSALSSLADYW
ncbi:hypothetical protein BDV98DRAFT_91207 [Pterulicium gracile]|uniref:Uncharacterized protein n=1 Tax=Pterulicium gracile TaxID=1884261 RepID=A0A5C3QGD9_9AGAR|nr:hypothetical protein BDV98DRAFT_91207 [Pterula gracilis]